MLSLTETCPSGYVTTGTNATGLPPCTEVAVNMYINTATSEVCPTNTDTNGRTGRKSSADCYGKYCSTNNNNNNIIYSDLH